MPIICFHTIITDQLLQIMLKLTPRLKVRSNLSSCFTREAKRKIISLKNQRAEILLQILGCTYSKVLILNVPNYMGKNIFSYEGYSFYRQISRFCTI